MPRLVGAGPAPSPAPAAHVTVSQSSARERDERRDGVLQPSDVPRSRGTGSELPRLVPPGLPPPGAAAAVPQLYARRRRAAVAPSLRLAR